ncbi:GNAT family N-acetyltransferase [Paracidobacterium acidisoli]|uniref:GNAT family N-acetyltransferase n=1 Tax=Paracidobacterium acidisoli TaxID=2303751 RepID=A0A372IIW6_9BACT|nr:GNAT family N-acetyltransferase [Paracidobacterium acidisoli]MBT9333308.1 GNAT family N-acetyltransferase [Paracidobacterium acidisoli]
MRDLTIREASEEDVAAILELYAASGVESAAPGAERFTPEEARKHLALLRRYPSYRVFVAVLDGRIAGTYELLIMDNLAKRGRRSGVVEDVAVAPECQGQGIGRAMMLHAREACRAAGCYKLTLSSNLRREEAHRFYESVGFERHGYSFRIDL